MRFSNFHQHTTFSDGKATIEETVKHAIELGFEAIGISDHSFTPFDTSYCMKKERETDYLNEIHRVKEKYAGQIEIYAGLEADYFSETDNSRFDYLIGSVHYLYGNGEYHAIDHTKEQNARYLYEVCGGSKEKYAENYYAAVADNVRKKQPKIVGHFDVITKFGLFDEFTDDGKKYRSIATDALIEVLGVTPLIEVNTGAISRGFRKSPYPAPFLLKEILRRGGEVILSSDSHALSSMDAQFKESAALLSSLGFKYVARLCGTGLAHVKID